MPTVQQVAADTRKRARSGPGETPNPGSGRAVRPSAKPLQASVPARVRRKVVRSCGRSALERVLRIHERLGNEQQITAESVAREFEVSPRTIKRDIELMRDRLGVPIAWDASSRSYYYTHHCDLLPLLRIEADEALALAVAGRTFAAWHGSPLGRALTAALEKIATVVGGAVSVPGEELQPLLYAPDDPAGEAEHRYFAQLLEAIQRRRELRLAYRKPKAGGTAAARTVHPLHLAWLDHRWMLVAYDTGPRALRHFLLARISGVQFTGARFELPAGFELNAYLRGSLGRFHGGGEYEVRVAFDAVVAPYVRERPWHRSQTLVERADGGIEATWRLNNLIDIERRVLACGGHAEVLAPAELRRTVSAAAVAMATRYASADEPPTWLAAEEK